jgi:prohibitin 1
VRGAQFTKAVEAKQVAQQDAERARFVVLKADQARAPLGLRVGLGIARRAR